MTFTSAPGIGTVAAVSFPCDDIPPKVRPPPPLPSRATEWQRVRLRLTHDGQVRGGVDATPTRSARRLSPASENESLLCVGSAWADPRNPVGSPPPSVAVRQLGRAGGVPPVLSPCVAARQLGRAAATNAAREGYARIAERRVLVIGEGLIGPDFLGFLRDHARVLVEVVRARTCCRVIVRSL